jgi:predicted HD phosphohydrolase
VPEEVHWVVLHHGVFQSYFYAHHLGGDRDARDRYRGHRWAGLCEEFCERWDQNSFDPDFPTHPLESFEDEVREVFGRVAWDPNVVTIGTERLT